MKTTGESLCRLLLGGTFAYAAASKLLDPSAFATDIGHYRLLPYPLTILLAVYLPWLELLCAAAVLIRRLERGALVLLLGLCTLFSVALASAWWRGLDINCGCFGAGAPGNLSLAFVRSLCLGGLGLYLLRLTGRKPAESGACIQKHGAIQ
ncbi:MAG TPA: MauE/DoxX family redox-associated membrane protein [Lacunisphaera sp.]|nr:MauE/DoxX family redox-associated membrane protein [Lacunisphaera sp.]